MGLEFGGRGESLQTTVWEERCDLNWGGENAGYADDELRTGGTRRMGRLMDVSHTLLLCYERGT
jgi:hypothetical protein